MWDRSGVEVTPGCGSLVSSVKCQVQKGGASRQGWLFTLVDFGYD